MGQASLQGAVKWERSNGSGVFAAAIKVSRIDLRDRNQCIMFVLASLPLRCSRALAQNKESHLFQTVCHSYSCYSCDSWLPPQAAIFRLLSGPFGGIADVGMRA
jgi:hypothetical protein